MKQKYPAKWFRYAKMRGDGEAIGDSRETGYCERVIPVRTILGGRHILRSLHGDMFSFSFVKVSEPEQRSKIILENNLVEGHLVEDPIFVVARNFRYYILSIVVRFPR